MPTNETNPVTAEALRAMSISQIASLVYRNWKPVNFAAKPYLEAMLDLETVNDNYGCDSGSSIVLYFLCNATSFRGEVARLVKAELKRRTGSK